MLVLVVLVVLLVALMKILLIELVMVIEVTKWFLDKNSLYLKCNSEKTYYAYQKSVYNYLSVREKCGLGHLDCYYLLCPFSCLGLAFSAVYQRKTIRKRRCSNIVLTSFDVCTVLK